MTEPYEPIACRFCGAAMARLACGPITLDRCGHCAGLWFDGGELDAVLEWPEDLPPHAPTGRAERAPDALIVCPRCTGMALEPMRREGVLVHRCPGCHGVLVGRSAIEAILAARRRADPSFDFDIPSGGGRGGSGDADDGNVIGAVLDFIGELLSPPG
jgi:Zn-finger nucleic acid-binding protein